MRETPFQSTKILHQIEAIDRWQNQMTVWPVHAKVDPTNACNHECPDCIFKGLLAINSDSLTKDELFRLIDSFAEIDLKAITFSGGGEPLVNPATLPAMEYAKKAGIECALITNGVLMVGDARKVLLECCTWVRVSLDAATPAQHQQTHGAKPGDFSRILENLLEMVAMRGSSTCTLGAGYLVARKTLGGIYGFARLCSGLGIDYAQYRPYHEDYILLDGWPDIWNDEIFPAMQSARADFSRGEDFRVLWSPGQFSDLLEKNWGRIYDRCEAHAFEAVIGATGDVWFCCAYKGNNKFSLGNIKTTPFKEIWQNGARQKLLDSTDVHRCIPLCQLNQANVALKLVADGSIKLEEVRSKPAQHVNFI